MNNEKLIWSGKNFSFDLTDKPIIYSIVNVTPDSFYDGNERNLEIDYIVNRVQADLDNGADVIELGAKSSRPGYEDISPEQEWERLKEPLEILRQKFPQTVLAIDTDEAYVMEQGLQAGADIINDIDGFDTEEKLEIIAKYQPAVVSMNNGRTEFQYAECVADEFPAFFQANTQKLLQIGLKKENIAIDAGVGFYTGDNKYDALERIKSTAKLTQLGFPIMVAISRKSFMTHIFDVPVEDRLIPTLLFEAKMIADGGRILRVHDVKATRLLIDGLKIYQEH
ncbi:MAG: dihydropteroate synthase [Streptococcaceae bacterium]|nr:dihydropteroate synthase [Streptococcaceae bacterium]